MVIDGVNESELDNEIKQAIYNITGFYRLHMNECKTYYDLSHKTCEIYSEIKSRKEFNKLLIKSSIVIITANEFEKNILHMSCKAPKIKHYELNCFENETCPIYINIYFFKINSFNIVHLEAIQTGSYTIGGSADLVRFVLDNPYLKPQCVISFGICFGNEIETIDLGDVIIAKKLYPYFISAKINETKLTVTDNNIFEIEYKMKARIKFLIERNYFQNLCVRFGNIVTGEAVISNALMKKIFIEAATNQPILGGEMEGYGLFKECQGYRNTIPCLLVKSVCDWGVAKNIDEYINNKGNNIGTVKDQLQAYATYKAYNVLDKILCEDSGLFNESVYDYITENIRKYKSDSVKTITTSMMSNLLSKYYNTSCHYNKDYINLFLCILEEDKIIEQKDNIYRIL